MKTKQNLLVVGMLLAATTAGFGQPTIRFSTSIYSITENAGAVTLTVQRAGDTTTVVTVDCATANGTATAGLDYTGTNGTLTFAAGETNQTIIVPILNDGIVESTETFTVALSNPTGGAALGTPATATVRITDNDAGLQFEFRPLVSSSYFRVGEAEGFILLAVIRGDDGDFPVSVDFATSGISAASGVDFMPTNGTLLFAPGQKVALFTVPIVNDGLKEANETFRVTLSNPATRCWVRRRSPRSRSWTTTPACSSSRSTSIALLKTTGRSRWRWCGAMTRTSRPARWTTPSAM